MGHTHAILMVLFVAGFALFAYGVTYSAPAAGQYLEVGNTSADRVPADAEVRDYRNLSSQSRVAFDRALRTDSVAAIASTGSEADADYVRYRDGYYRVSVVTDGPRSASFEFSLGILGFVLSALSTVVYLLVRRETGS